MPKPGTAGRIHPEHRNQKEAQAGTQIPKAVVVNIGVVDIGVVDMGVVVDMGAAAKVTGIRGLAIK